MPPRITVLGAGVSGLSSALALSEAGYDDIEILTDRATDQTASAVAAACWYPFHVGPYNHRWAARTYEHFVALATHPRTGIDLVPSREFFETPIADAQLEHDFWWRTLPGINFRPLDLIPPRAPYVAAVQFTVPVIRMPDYLAFLYARLAARNVPVHHRHVDRFEDIPAETIINCTALGSARLCPDPTLYPAQGQVLAVENFGLTEMLFGTGRDESWPLYLIPRGPDTIVGGTYRPHVASEQPTEHDAQEILARCAAYLDSRVRSARILSTRTGLRPCRQAGPRVEAERGARQLLIHNYGHAGGGVTLSWGCAETVVDLLRTHHNA